MKVLHICNNFCGSKVHANLYDELDKQGVQQTVYTYYRDPSFEGKNKFEAQSTDFVYRPILSTYHRVLYHKKIHDVYADLKSQLSQVIPNYDLVHAVTMFSDGAVAYRLYKDFGIPYIISVRNTDINEFLEVAHHTWSEGMQVLRNAKKIVFISKAPKEKFCRHFLVKRILPKISEKMIIQPNGVDDYWLDHIVKGEQRKNNNIIYVGKFDMNKNVVRLVDAVLSLRDEFKDIHLHLVGGGGSREEKIKALVTAHPDTLTYHGKIFDKDVLKELYNKCSVFAMPSIHETFGLVYIEAMTQGLAVLYTKNQGIDGLFDEQVGAAVQALSTDSIKDGLRKILKNRRNYQGAQNVDFSRFHWQDIANTYKDIYEKVING